MYLYINGDVYEGEWKDNKRQGKGVYTCAATKLKVCSDPIILSFNIAKHGLPVKYRSLIHHQAFLRWKKATITSVLQKSHKIEIFVLK